MSAASTTDSPLRGPAVPSAVSARTLIGFVAMIFGMFMAILDIQIVSASLSEIQAGLSASADEISWVQTAYLIAEVVMIPLSGFLGRMMSTRIMFAISAAGFTLASVACASATSIEQMIVFRAIQGFIGGGMIPSVFAAAFTIFPRNKMAIVSPIIGLIATLAPTVGPTIGGYLSHAFSWHWLFLVNVIPGIGVTLAVLAFVDFDKPNWKLFDHFDWWGLLGMAVMLGSLEYVLEEGPGDDWFDSRTICLFAALAAVSGSLFLWRAFTAREPIVDLTAYSDRNFLVGSVFSFTMGIGLYGLTYIYPRYLSSIRGYDALMIGETMFVSGLSMFFMAPVSGIMSRKMDPRLMLMIGFTGFAIGTYMVSGITADWDFNELLIPQILRGASLMFCMVPINNLALGTLPPHRLKNASGLYNLSRNLGGAVGLAVINSMLNSRTDLHIARLHEAVAWGHVTAEETLDKLTELFSTSGGDAERLALMKLGKMVHRQAQVMAFEDIFLVLTGLFVTIALLSLAMRKPVPAGGGRAAH